jgi:hypothetical protein
MTPIVSKKVQNVRRKSTTYFSIDDENFPPTKVLKVKVKAR